MQRLDHHRTRLCLNPAPAAAGFISNLSTSQVTFSNSISSVYTLQVNARYSKLELALDGLYKVILLLKKKKYAAIKFETGPDGKEREVRLLSSGSPCMS